MVNTDLLLEFILLVQMQQKVNETDTTLKETKNKPVKSGII